jgi:hypothetical protein
MMCLNLYGSNPEGFSLIPCYMFVGKCTEDIYVKSFWYFMQDCDPFLTILFLCTREVYTINFNDLTGLSSWFFFSLVKQEYVWCIESRLETSQNVFGVYVESRAETSPNVFSV